MKQEWLNAELTGQGAYFRWISKAWNENLTDAERATFNEGRPKRKTCKLKKKKETKWKNNLVGRTWIKNMAYEGHEKSIVKKWDDLVRTKGRSDGKRKGKLNKDQILKFVGENIEKFKVGTLPCLQARANNMQCRNMKDVTDKNEAKWAQMKTAGQLRRIINLQTILWETNENYKKPIPTRKPRGLFENILNPAPVAQPPNPNDAFIDIV